MKMKQTTDLYNKLIKLLKEEYTNDIVETDPIIENIKNKQCNNYLSNEDMANLLGPDIDNDPGIELEKNSECAPTLCEDVEELMEVLLRIRKARKDKKLNHQMEDTKMGNVIDIRDRLPKIVEKDKSIDISEDELEYKTETIMVESIEIIDGIEYPCLQEMKLKVFKN